MKKLDELILKVLQLNPQMHHQPGSNMYYLIYKNITFGFWNMDYNQDLGLVRIDQGDAHNIQSKTKLAVIQYFKKTHKIDDILNMVNKDLRKEKLLSIKEVSE